MPLPPMPEARIVSVIVPCRNEREHIEAFCRSVAAQQVPEGWTLEVWAQNLLEEEYTQVGFSAPLQGTAFNNPTNAVQPDGSFYIPFNPANGTGDTATYNAYLGQPRTYGVTLRVRY